MWAAVTLVAAAHIVRSILRGGDFRPDMPLDAIIGLVLVALVVARIALARSGHPDGPPGDPTDERDGSRGGDREDRG